MDIKAVKTTGYKDKYYALDNGNYILNEDYMEKHYKTIFPTIKNQLEVKPIYFKEEKVFVPFPSQEAMLMQCEKKATEIFKKININKVKNSKITQVSLLVDYLVKNNVYDMSTYEERDYNIDLVKIDRTYSQYAENLKTGNYKTQEHKELEHKIANHYNEINLRNLYTSLIRKRGVCNNYSIALSFLSSLLGIDCFVAAIDEVGEGPLHMLNLFFDEKSDQFYFVDVTKCWSNNRKYGEEAILKDVIISKDKFNQKYPNTEIKNIFIMGNSNQKYENMIVGIMHEEGKQKVLDSTSNNNPFEAEINYAKKFIQNNYQEKIEEEIENSL